MNLKLILLAALLTGCGTGAVRQEVRAIHDFITVSDLEQVDIIRLYSQLNYSYVNDDFVTISVSDRHYLVEFSQRCWALSSNIFTTAMVDYRHDASYLRVGDTIRGCPIDKIFEATADQLKEIKALGRSEET
jgi:Family of unknown function (DUF6491)